jgi:hypothetical protein
MSDAMYGMACTVDILFLITDTDCVPVVAEFPLPEIASAAIAGSLLPICSNRAHIGTKQGDSTNHHKQTNCSFHRDSPCTRFTWNFEPLLEVCFGMVSFLGPPFIGLKKAVT